MAQIYNRLVQKAYVSGVPILGQFEVTPLCNFRCGMCYVRQSQQQIKDAGGLLPPEFWVDLAQQAAKEGMLSVLLTGGEPFLYPKLRTLYETLYDMGFKLSINSNGSLITEETADWLAKRPPEKISITLYGASDATYARFCGDAHGYRKLCRGVRLLWDRGIRMRFNCSLGTENADDLIEMIAFAKRYDSRLRMTPYLTPPLRRTGCAGSADGRLCPQEAGYYTAYNDYLQNTPQDFLRLARKYRAFTELTPEIIKEAAAGPPGHMTCLAGRCSFWVDWTGRISGCGMVTQPSAVPVFRDAAGRISDSDMGTQPQSSHAHTGFREVWNDLKQRTRELETSPVCANCPNRKNCPSCLAMLYGENGNVYERPAYLCEVRRYAAYYYGLLAYHIADTDLTEDEEPAEEPEGFCMPDAIC